MKPSGANNFLKWRRSIDEHLELRRLTWDEYGMFNWLCTKASPRTGSLRTSWPILAEQTTLSVNYVSKLCGNLKRKGYIAYPEHRGRRFGLVEVAIDKFPLVDGTYTRLANRPGRSQSEVLAEVPAELDGQKPGTTDTLPLRKTKKKLNNSLRVRSADPAHRDEFLNKGPKRHLSKAEALAQAPPALRETLELYCFKTGRAWIDPADLEHLPALEAAHTPATIQKAITRAVERFERRGQNPSALTLEYLWASLRHYTTRKPPEPQRKDSSARPDAEPAPKYPIGLIRL